MGSVSKFGGEQFQFHAKSEHTINGKRFDMEMNTVHYPDKGERRRLEEKETKKEEAPDIEIIASAVGLIFDRVDYDKSVTAEEKLIIDKFFDSLGFDATVNPDKDSTQTLKASTDVPYGDLMEIVNFANRWVYTGSLTTPPCSVGVYFQVVERVLPIS